MCKDGSPNYGRFYLRQESLGEELLGPAAELDVEEGVVRLLDLGVPEAAQAELHHGPVEVDTMISHHIQIHNKKNIAYLL